MGRHGRAASAPVRRHRPQAGEVSKLLLDNPRFLTSTSVGPRVRAGVALLLAQAQAAPPAASCHPALPQARQLPAQQFHNWRVT